MSVFVVTGGAGFIGSNLAEGLTAEGHEVTIVDDFSSGKRENVTHLTEKVTVVEGSICDPALLDQAFAGADYVLHQAALPSVQRSVEDPVETNRINVGGTLTVLQAARAAGVKRVVFAASSSAYGNQPKLPKVETMPPQPLSPYAASKLAGEHYCQSHFQSLGVETASLRYFNVFGRRQDPASQYAAVVPIFITKLLAGERPLVHGDGEQSRDFTHVANVVQANLLAATAPKAAGEVFNVGCGARYTLNELLAALNQIIGTDIEAIYGEPRAGDVRHSHADIAKAEELLGYEPTVTFEDGLTRTVEWYKSRAATDA